MPLNPDQPSGEARETIMGSDCGKYRPGHRVKGPTRQMMRSPGGEYEIATDLTLKFPAELEVWGEGLGRRSAGWQRMGGEQ
jgi:hypothetical protein